MADDNNQSQGSSNQAFPGKVEKSDADVSRWIKNLAALVGVFGALAGIWVSVHELMEKAAAEERTAQLLEKAEQHKLDVATLQLGDQRESRRDQAKQHSQDIRLELQKHLLDIKQQKDAASAEEQRDNSDRLSVLISHMFSNENSSEGDLATLFNFIDRDQTSKAIVENAVLARLEAPRSHEEIDLGFRLLERIGSSAIDSTVQANINARRRYDEYLFSKFYNLAIGQNKDNSLRIAELGSAKINSIEISIANEMALDRTYVYASVNSKLVHGFEGEYHLPLDSTSARFSREELATAVIKRSNLAIGRQLANFTGDAKSLDLSGAYLIASLFQPHFWIHYERANFKGTFIGTDGYQVTPDSELWFLRGAETTVGAGPETSPLATTFSTI